MPAIFIPKKTISCPLEEGSTSAIVDESTPPSELKPIGKLEKLFKEMALTPGAIKAINRLKKIICFIIFYYHQINNKKLISPR
jgi:hypothetical protein